MRSRCCSSSCPSARCPCCMMNNVGSRCCMFYPDYHSLY
jgi:hypothetical protein